MRLLGKVVPNEVNSLQPHHVPDQRGKLFGILVTFRRPNRLAQTLRALAAQERRLDRLVVVDNDPLAENEEAIRRSYPDVEAVEYVPASENLGPAGGIAIGMERVLRLARDRDWLVLMDDDDPPVSSALLGDLEQFGEDMLARDPRTAAVGVVGARFDWRRGRVIGMNRITDGQRSDAVAVDTIGGGHLPFYRIEAVRSVGTFWEGLFFGCEELEYGLRLRDRGFSLYAHSSLWRSTMDANAHIVLDNRPSFRVSEASWRRYYELRNLLYILRSFGRRGTAARVSLVRALGKPLANLVVRPRTSMQHLKLNVRACRDGWTGRMGRTLEPDGYARPNDE